MSVSSNSLPMSSRHTRARMRTRSMTPLNWSSAPIGSWIGTGFTPRRSWIISTSRQKLAPVRSSLLMKQIRGTW